MRRISVRCDDYRQWKTRSKRPGKRQHQTCNRSRCATDVIRPLHASNTFPYKAGLAQRHRKWTIQRDPCARETPNPRPKHKSLTPTPWP